MCRYAFHALHAYRRLPIFLLLLPSPTVLLQNSYLRADMFWKKEKKRVAQSYCVRFISLAGPIWDYADSWLSFLMR
ncbi:hypothetical protein KP509_10G024700 [Ceratopteris richardii]|uniref:Secreted protein n=1 Tax=Ceratopteris richardii TaxID=49495 RepID=A0A8T2TZJ4_CERRI|nr:hypothetical protein KP509_10G024700 [Ceratopteris richardii]